MNYNDLINEYKQKYIQIGEGRNRIVFQLDDDWVIKLPKNEEGEGDNSFEEHIYLKNTDSYYAKCSVIIENDIVLLKMEKVEICINTTNFPEWVDFIDCAQVGYTLDGRLVAFDFGYY